MSLWRKITNLTVEKMLLMAKGAVIKVKNDDGTESTVNLAELAALDGIAASDLAKIDGITNGTVAAGKAAVPDSNKDIGDFRNLDAVNIDAGASGTAGTVDVFPATASKGKLAITCTNQTGDTTVTLNANAMGQATTVNIPDPGASAGYVVMTTAALTLAEADVLQDVTPGTSAPSKALVLDAAESLNWATTDATASETCTLTVTDTRTGAGATGWAAKFDLESNVALGAYANGVYGYLGIGASGKVTGLGAGVCGEIALSAGCTDGTYACIEAEMGMPSGAVTGTAASFLYLSLYGADAGTFDTSGFLFHLAGVTKGSGKLLQDVTSGSTARPVQVLKVKTPDGTRYLPLYDTAACGA